MLKYGFDGDRLEPLQKAVAVKAVFQHRGHRNAAVNGRPRLGWQIEIPDPHPPVVLALEEGECESLQPPQGKDFLIQEPVIGSHTRDVDAACDELFRRRRHRNRPKSRRRKNVDLPAERLPGGNEIVADRRGLRSPVALRHGCPRCARDPPPPEHDGQLAALGDVGSGLKIIG